MRTDNGYEVLYAEKRLNSFCESILKNVQRQVELVQKLCCKVGIAESVLSILSFVQSAERRNQGIVIQTTLST